MAQPPPVRADQGAEVPFCASSGERRPRRRRPLGGRIVLLASLLLAAAVGFFELRHKESPAPGPTPTPHPPATVTAAPHPTATATPTPVAMASRWVTLEPKATPTATPWPTEPPRRRRGPAPTSAASQCVEARWSAEQGTAPLGRVIVTVEATNRCGRDLGPLDVWFRITGWRKGAVVQTVAGHPLETVYDRHSERVVIGLPGSLDWYDRITVEILDAAP